MRFSCTAAGCCPRAGAEARGALAAGAGAGPRAGTCPPPTAAGRPPPCWSPPRPFSCANAATQIRTDSTIIVFNVNLTGEISPGNLVARHAPTHFRRSFRYAGLGVVTHALGRAAPGVALRVLLQRHHASALAVPPGFVSGLGRAACRRL